jgi:hypothetical protein
MLSREDQIQLALTDYESGKIKSQNALAKMYGIPRSTLRNRINGMKQPRESHESQQRLSAIQEEFLVKWIIEQDAQGFPPSHTRTREMATRILRLNGDTLPLGKGWITNFIKRNSSISSCIGRKIDSKRIQNSQPEQLQKFYEYFHRIQCDYGVELANIWNVDEHGIALGICANYKVIAKSGKKHTLVQASENREWVSIIECISAVGNKTRPLVIFKGKNPQTSWFNDKKIPDWHYTTSENGWTSNSHALNWFKSCFLPETKPADDSYRILVMDGHGSHSSIDFLFEAFRNKVYIVFLPAHTSHVLQPLDLGTFASVKLKYRTLIRDLSYLDDAAPIKKRRFIQCYEQTREDVLTPRIIKCGWKAAGLVPYDPSKGMNSSQLRIQTSTTRPQTPLQLSTSSDVLSTPQNRQDIRNAIQVLEKSQKLNRSTRSFLAKTGKTLDRLTAQQALQETTILKQETQLEVFRNKKTKKRIPIDPNSRFANIEQIKKSMEEAEQLAAKQQAKEPELQAKKASEAALEAGLQACLFEFHI